jgi:RNA polymerase sigma-70 factor (ECF subfamily)
MTAAPELPSAMSCDRDLVASVAAGDLEGLGELFDRHAPDLRRYFARLGAPAGDVDDLIQATFLEVVRAAPRFDAAHPVRAWLFGVATWMWRRHRRSLGRTATRLAAWAGLSKGRYAPSPDEIFEGDEASRRFQRAFEGLSAKKREVFTLVTLEGFSGEEAARTLGVPINTIWTRLHHARLELRQALEEETP